MDVGTALSAAQTLFAALQCSELKELFSFLNYESELEQLERTVGTVRAVLTDAASNRVQVDTSQAHQYLDELKYAVYDAEDLLDEFVTLAKSKKFTKRGSVCNEMCPLLPPFNSLHVAHKMSKQVKVLSNTLREIADRHSTYGFKLVSRPTSSTIRAETVSHVNEGDIIGREKDVEDIVGRLLDSNARRDVSCLPIVGLGGLGKTALGKLVYNDSRIEKEFSQRLWTCVSDQDEEDLDVKAILSKILESATRKNHGDLAMETIHKELKAELAGKKCLIVLDDVWSENCLQLPSLVGHLRIGLRGSWIVLTTRSQETARIVGNEYVHHLKGLSEEDSWNLFRRIAFGEGDQELANHCPDLVKVGKDIVEKCANVPLAIKVVASLLRGQDKKVWGSFQEKEIGKLKVGKKDGIEPILKLSYDHLQLPLKTCFSYCAVFPKDYVINKRKLVDLWMAQGYIIPQEGQSVEDTGEEYFSILLDRSFFQDVEKDEYGEVVSCKIHDLMHDIAEEVAGKEVYRADLSKTRLDKKKVRHLSYIGGVEGTNLSSTKTKIRTCLSIDCRGQYVTVDKELENWVCLRALELCLLRIASLPSALGKLLHLRYLDLSWNHNLRVLPKSITKLHNLQTLILQWCNRLKQLPRALGKLRHLRYLDLSWNESLKVLPDSIADLHDLHTLKMERCRSLKELPSAMGKLLHLRYLDLSWNLSLLVLPNSMGDLHNLQTLKLKFCQKLKALPEDFSNLVNLKVLDIDGCLVLRRMPRGMGKFRNLEELTFFVAGDETSTLKQNIVHQMEELGALAGLRGSLHIRILKNTEYVEGGVREGGYLRNKEHLTCVRIEFPYFNPEETSLGGMPEDEQRLLLQNLRPHSNLRELSLQFYRGSRIPSWAPEDDLATVVPNLTEFELFNCPALQYLPFLRNLGNLKTLQLRGLLELEYIENGTGAGIVSDSMGASQSQPFFPSLEKLTLGDLRKLKRWWRDDELIDGDTNQPRRLLASFPTLRELEISDCPNFTCTFTCPALEELHLAGAINERLRITIPTEAGFSKLRKFRMGNVGRLKSAVPIEAFQCLQEMEIRCDSKIVSLSEMEEVFRSCFSSLQRLQIWECLRLESVRRGLRHLTALEYLSLRILPNLNLGNTAEGEQEEEEDGMPWRGLGHSLRYLELLDLPKMVNLPEGMRYLTSLEDLQIYECKGLESVPEWMRDLTSLQTLVICDCSKGLRKRCQKDSGKDWPNIRHIQESSIS